MQFDASADTVWENPQEGGVEGIKLIFSKFECESRNSQPCALTLNLAKKGPFKLQLTDGSRIVGSEVFIVSPTHETFSELIIDEDSAITVSGKSTTTDGSSNAEFK